MKQSTTIRGNAITFAATAAHTAILAVTAALLSLGASGAAFGQNVSSSASSKMTTTTTPSVGAVGMISTTTTESVKRDKATVYRQVLPDGRVVYTDNPMTGQKIDKVIEVDVGSRQTWSAAQDMTQPAIEQKTPAPMPSGVNPAREAKAVRMDNEQRGLAAAQVRLAAAEARFEASNFDMRKIEEPRAGERSMGVNGKSRLNESYFERQSKQYEEHRLANIELDEALSMLRAAEGH